VTDPNINATAQSLADIIAPACRTVNCKRSGWWLASLRLHQTQCSRPSQSRRTASKCRPRINGAERNPHGWIGKQWRAELEARGC
jgi:hypothetical protein